MTKLQKREKGFTLTELAIVIAVIAILIAVLVPTFVSLINNANTSADEQAVKNMNTALSVHEATEDFDTVSDVVTALADDNYDLDNYSPLISGMQFYWVKSINRIVYAQSSSPYTVSYPSEYTSLEYKEGNWYSLNGEIELDSNWTVAGSGDSRTVEISSGAQLASLMNSFSTYSTGTLTIKLTDNIDLMGASYKFGSVAKSGATATVAASGVNGTINIESASGTCTIYGFRDDTNAIYGSGEYANKGYGYGLFCSINSGATVNIKNVNFDGMTVEDTALGDTGTLALISGYISGTLNMEKVTFTNCSVKGYQKVATIAGQLSGKVDLKNVVFKDTTVSASCEGAKVIAYVQGENYGSAVFNYDNDCSFSDITVVANEDYYSYYKNENPLGSFTTTQDGFECLFVYHNSGIDDNVLSMGDLLTVTTQALYIYSVTQLEPTNITKYSGCTVKYGKTVSYNGETYYLRSTNNPGSAAFGS